MNFQFGKGLVILSPLLMLFLFSCTTSAPTITEVHYQTNNNDYGLTTAHVIQTTAAGDKLAAQADVTFDTNELNGIAVVIDPDNLKQTIEGFGGSFTESSAYVLACLNASQRAEILSNYFSTNGANYTLARTHIGSCDFTVNGSYSYDDVANDTNLTSFSIAPDLAGFTAGGDVVETSYDLLPLITNALEIQPTLKILGTAWTAPKWMKSTGTFLKGNLRTDMYECYANYIKKYIEAYSNKGIHIWAVTPVNEPWDGVPWESMSFDSGENNPTFEANFIANNLGAKMQALGVKIFCYDHNLDGAYYWAANNLNNASAKPYIDGIALHWYASTYMVYTDVLDQIHSLDSSKSILHTEACIDEIDDEVTDMWKNWGYWWQYNFLDWANGQGDHPAYAATHRYARNIIEGLNHWYVGWIDWNLVLNKNGLPNWKNNQCAAPVMVDTATKEVFYTPLYYIMSHFSKYIRPGDKAATTYVYTPGIGEDVFYATSTLSSNGSNIVVEVLNTTSAAVTYKIQVGRQNASITIPANAVQTVIIPKP